MFPRLCCKFMAVILLLSCAFAGFSAQVIDDMPVSTNHVFYLADEAGHRTNEFRFDQKIIYVIEPLTTNSIFCRTVPWTRALIYRLDDQAGRRMRKTELGYKTGPPARVPEPLDVAPRSDGTLAPLRYELFRPVDVFVVTNRGVYDLNLKIRVNVKIPPDLMTNRGSVDLGCTAGPKSHYGIIPSGPLPVKLIRE